MEFPFTKFDCSLAARWAVAAGVKGATVCYKSLLHQDASVQTIYDVHSVHHLSGSKKSLVRITCSYTVFSGLHG